VSSGQTISVVVPTFNLSGFIEATLRSVLAQTSPPDEVLVVDDGSTDGTLAIVRKIADESGGLVRVIARPHQGPGATRNAGVAAARGTWVAFLDGDDLWLPEKLARVRQAIDADQAATIFTHPCIEVSLAGGEVRVPLPDWYDAGKALVGQLYQGDFFWTSCVVARRTDILEVGGFDETLWSAQDYDLWLKLARKGRLHVIPDFMGRYIVRAGSVSSNPILRCRALIRIAHRHAPFLVPVLGAFGARKMRVRAVLLAYHFVLTNLRATRPRDLSQLMLCMPAEVARAVVAQIR
jgi:glycosyltransferase involved in cell wall biosynthesis